MPSFFFFFKKNNKKQHYLKKEKEKHDAENEYQPKYTERALWLKQMNIFHWCQQLGFNSW